MPFVPATMADWLTGQAIYSQSETQALKNAWDDLARDSELITPYASRADATAESARQGQFLAHPIAVEYLQIAGFFASLVGQIISVTADRPGWNYVACLVIGADENQDGSTNLVVLRRMDL